MSTQIRFTQKSIKPVLEMLSVDWILVLALSMS